MRFVLRKLMVVCSVAATAITIMTCVAAQPLTSKDTLRHTIATFHRPTTSRSRHSPFLSVQRSLLSGIGSWYGDMFDGKRTASGEIFDQDALTACHPTLPFGTLVRVINLRNRRSVIVRINDRGLRSDRVIDLSLAAAERIDMLDTGVTPVKLEVITKDRS